MSHEDNRELQGTLFCQGLPPKSLLCGSITSYVGIDWRRILRSHMEKLCNLLLPLVSVNVHADHRIYGTVNCVALMDILQVLC